MSKQDEKPPTPGTPTHQSGVGKSQTRRRRARNIFRQLRIMTDLPLPSFKAWWARFKIE